MAATRRTRRDGQRGGEASNASCKAWSSSGSGRRGIRRRRAAEPLHRVASSSVRCTARSTLRSGEGARPQWRERRWGCRLWLSAPGCHGLVLKQPTPSSGPTLWARHHNRRKTLRGRPGVAHSPRARADSGTARTLRREARQVIESHTPSFAASATTILIRSNSMTQQRWSNSRSEVPLRRSLDGRRQRLRVPLLEVRLAGAG